MKEEDEERDEREMREQITRRKRGEQITRREKRWGEQTKEGGDRERLDVPLHIS